MAFAFKLQSPAWDGVGAPSGGAGYEIPLPAFNDQAVGQSMAAILTLFDGDNQIADFRQLTEAITFQGFLTAEAATLAGYANAVQMRDEIRRTRFQAANYGKNNSGTVKSWLDEGSGGGTWTSAALIAAGEDDTTARAPGIMRLVYDDYWNPTTGTYKKLFGYGTVMNFAFGPRPAATTKTRIPFTLQFGLGDVKLGDN